ncbi:MAG TPA: hypothetical protein VMV92_02320 [Streptosporangiaceae bacterium]|nr:hypothetical protein [Streptosporangiaceae bacterium]
MRNFLVVFNRRTGANTVREFPAGRGREAIRERFILERQYRADPDIEIVVLGSGSREELEKTHSRYFRSGDAQSERACG